MADAGLLCRSFRALSIRTLITQGSRARFACSFTLGSTAPRRRRSGYIYASSGRKNYAALAAVAANSGFEIRDSRLIGCGMAGGCPDTIVRILGANFRE